MNEQIQAAVMFLAGFAVGMSVMNFFAKRQLQELHAEYMDMVNKFSQLTRKLIDQLRPPT